MMSEDYRLQYLQMDTAPQLSSHEKWPYYVELKEHLWYGNKIIFKVAWCNAGVIFAEQANNSISNTCQMNTNEC